MKPYILPFFFSLLISTVCFVALQFFLITIQINAKNKYHPIEKISANNETVPAPDKLQSEYLYIHSCVQQKNKPNEFETDCQKISPDNPIQQTGNNSKSSNDDNVKKAMDADPVIYGIRFLLVIALAVQLFLAFYTRFLTKSAKIDRHIFYVSDWAINTPPILGVLANLESFALVVALSDGNQGNIMAYFPKYFFDAVNTTLIGGIFYIINLFLNIFIHPRLEEI